MKYLPIDSQLFIKNRTLFNAKIKGDDLAIERVTMAVLVWVCTLLRVYMRKAVEATECLHADVPVLVRKA